LLGAGISGATFTGCPQLLEDGFEVNPALPATALDSGGHLPLLDAGVEPGGGGAAGASGASGAGTSGSGGAPSAGAGGSSEGPDASAGAGGTQIEPTPDAGPTFVPVTEIGGLLAHRYRFDGTGSTVADSVGSAHGTSVGALQGNGKVTLSGNVQYVELPDGIISSLESVTVEAWVNWLATPSSAGAYWQNVFDFGANQGAGEESQATTHLFLIAQESDNSLLVAGYSLTGTTGELHVYGTSPLPVSSDLAKGTQVVLVANALQGSLSVYVDGAFQRATSPGQAIDLSAIADVNNWLGRSLYGGDPYFVGEMLDVRIYGAPLTDAQVSLSHSLGADAEL
ncbi:MAG TPA: LamG domain-containing protein, partial [Polyangiaceae bacterium]|nr:LamG domain-containing protein [Polyangiaceae bacterium]